MKNIVIYEEGRTTDRFGKSETKGDGKAPGGTLMYIRNKLITKKEDNEKYIFKVEILYN